MKPLSIQQKIYNTFTEANVKGNRLLAILVDPEKFDLSSAAAFLRTLPKETTHIFVGGSTVPKGLTETLVDTLKLYTAKPIVLFPGDVSQITASADALLFLNLLSGRKAEYLIGQQVKAVTALRENNLETISTGYLLIDGGHESAVARVTGTLPMKQEKIQTVVDTAKAGELMGTKLVYLEAGSGAVVPVSEEIIAAVKKEVAIPIIVGGGIRTEAAKEKAYIAGATMVVMGTAFENPSATPLKGLN